MNKFITSLDSLLKAGLIFMMSAIILAVLWQVLSRYLLQSPSSGSEEIARFLLIWISLIGAVYAYRTKLHLGLDVLVNKLKPAAKLNTTLFCHLVILGFSLAVMVFGGVNLVALTFNPIQISAALGIHMGYVYSVLPLAGVLISLYALNDLLQTWQQRSQLIEQRRLHASEVN